MKKLGVIALIIGLFGLGIGIGLNVQLDEAVADTELPAVVIEEQPVEEVDQPTEEVEEPVIQQTKVNTPTVVQSIKETVKEVIVTEVPVVKETVEEPVVDKVVEEPIVEVKEEVVTPQPIKEVVTPQVKEDPVVEETFEEPEIIEVQIEVEPEKEIDVEGLDNVILTVKSDHYWVTPEMFPSQTWEQARLNLYHWYWWGEDVFDEMCDYLTSLHFECLGGAALPVNNELASLEFTRIEGCTDNLTYTVEYFTGEGYMIKNEFRFIG